MLTSPMLLPKLENISLKIDEQKNLRKLKIFGTIIS